MKLALFPLWLATLLAFAQSTFAQCSPAWLPSQGLAGLNDSAYASTMWDPDGPGPLPPVVVIGGSFTIAGNLIVNGIATWNPVTSRWAALGTGFGPDTSGDAMKVTALTTLPNGDLIAGGNFGAADGAPANHIARWNGSHWSPLGGGMTGVQYPAVFSLATMPNGDIIAAGEFSLADGIPANNIARWNGSAWSPLTSATVHHFQPVHALAVLPDGKLAASNHNGARVALWDGTDWTPLGTGNYDGSIAQLTVLPTGELVAVGYFDLFAGIPTRGIALWNGTTWTSLGTGPVTYVSSLVVERDGNLVVCGANNNNGNSSSRGQMRRWNGSAWSAVITQIPDRPIYTSTLLPDGSILIGGEFHQITGDQASSPASPQAGHVARVVSGSCYPLSPGMNFEIDAMLTLPGGDIIAGGDLVLYYATYYSAIINRWNGSSWSPLGPAFSSVNNSYVNALASRPGGEIIAGGLFTNAGTTVVNNIASWDGATWRPFSTGLSDAVYALAVLPNGDLVAGGTFTSGGSTPLTYIARWDGSQWLPLGAGLRGDPFSGFNGVFSLLALPNGDLIAGGSFVSSGTLELNHIARWNGAAWSALSGSAVGVVYAITTLSDGSIVAGGVSNGVGRWNGTNWTRLGGTFNGAILSLKTLSNGNLIAGGQFTSVQLAPTARGIARWNGTTWSALGAGISSTYPPNYARYVSALAESPNGILNVGGYFETAGDLVSPYFARYAFAPVAPTITRHPANLTTCPSTSATFSAAATGTDPLSYFWQYESPANTWTDLDEGNNANIGFITGVHTSSISITNLGPAAASRYRVTITNSCGTAISNPATLTICPADFNCDSTTNLNDYVDFVQAFAANQPAADFNHDNTIDFFDYLDFVQAFSSGC